MGDQIRSWPAWPAQLEPQVAQIEPQVAQLEPQIAQLEPQVAQIEPHVAQLEAQVAQLAKLSLKLTKLSLSLAIWQSGPGWHSCQSGRLANHASRARLARLPSGTQTGKAAAVAQPWPTLGWLWPQKDGHGWLWSAMAWVGYGRPWSARAAQSRPWLSMAGHGWPWSRAPKSQALSMVADANRRQYVLDLERRDLSPLAASRTPRTGVSAKR